MGLKCSDRSSTPREVTILISKLSIKDDINFNTLLSSAGMAEWISHSISKRGFLSSKPTVGEKVSRKWSGVGRRKGESEEKVSRKKEERR